MSNVNEVQTNESKVSYECSGKYLGCTFTLDSHGQPIFVKSGKQYKLDRKKLKVFLDVFHKDDTSWKPLINYSDGTEVDTDVHILHKNGNECDNRVENLFVSKKRAIGQHSKCYRFAVSQDVPTNWRLATAEDEREICSVYGKRYEDCLLKLFRGETSNFVDRDGYERLWIHPDDIETIRNSVRAFQSYHGAKLVLVGKAQRPIYVSPKGLLMLETEGKIRLPIVRRERENFNSEWCGERFDRIVWRTFRQGNRQENKNSADHEIHHNIQTGLVMYDSKNGIHIHPEAVPAVYTYREWLAKKRPIVRILYSNELSTLSDTPFEYTLEVCKNKYDKMIEEGSDRPTKYGLLEILAIYFDQLYNGILLFDAEI